MTATAVTRTVPFGLITQSIVVLWSTQLAWAEATA